MSFRRSVLKVIGLEGKALLHRLWKQDYVMHMMTRESPTSSAETLLALLL